MSCYEIYYDGGAKKMRPINNFKEYAAIRNSTKNRRNTKLAREGDQDAKKHMAQFCYSCLPNADGTLKGTTRVSNSTPSNFCAHSRFSSWLSHPMRLNTM